MTGLLIGEKILTKNDLSWLSPNSKSHQSGINLPLRQFSDFFPEIFGLEGSPRMSFEIQWTTDDNEVFSYTENDVVWYSSKRELRLLHIGTEGLYHMAKIGDSLMIEREGLQLRIRVSQRDH
tara:strand:- start:64 stop:429 length:366 start_codon:yes stop_codon:yes gene_type:complete